MNSIELYNQMEIDFRLSICSDDWSHRGSKEARAGKQGDGSSA